MISDVWRAPKCSTTGFILYLFLHVTYVFPVLHLAFNLPSTVLLGKQNKTKCLLLSLCHMPLLNKDDTDSTSNWHEAPFKPYWSSFNDFPCRFLQVIMSFTLKCWTFVYKWTSCTAAGNDAFYFFMLVRLNLLSISIYSWLKRDIIFISDIFPTHTLFTTILGI